MQSGRFVKGVIISSAFVIVTILAWLLLPSQRIGALWLFTLLALIVFIIQKLLRKRNRLIQIILFYLITLILLNATVLSGVQARRQMEISRFVVIKPFYQTAAEHLLSVAQMQQNEVLAELPQVSISPFLTVGGKVNYGKHENAVFLYFNTDISFFDSYGFVFMKPEDEHLFFELSNTTGEKLSYQRFERIDDNWVYLKLY